MNAEAILSLLRQSVIFYIGFNIFIFVAIGFGWVGMYLIRDWPSVKGIILSSRVAHHHNHSSHGSSSSTSASVSYKYEVDGEKFTGYGIAPGGGLNAGGYIENVLQRFPAGKEVDVYYNPGLHSQSFLSKKSLTERHLWLYFVLGNLFMPFIVMFVNFIKSTIF